MKVVISFILMLCVLFSSELYAVDAHSQEGTVSQNFDSQSNGKILISKDEYHHKRRVAKTMLITGSIMSGGGLALGIGGGLVAIGGGFNESGSKVTAGAAMLSIGIVSTLVGVPLAIVGAVKKGNVKKKYYFVEPTADMSNQSYGIKLGGNF